MLMAAAESSTDQACCVLLPQTEPVGYLTALLLALSRLQTEFPLLLSDYARRGLTVGQRVRVLPRADVYRYAGVLDGYQESFKLEVLEAGDRSWKTFPVTQILRLEATERALPRGRANTNLGTFELSELDQLVGIQSGGNTSLFRNHVLYLSSRSEVRDLASGLRLRRRERGAAEGVLGTAIPWGNISPDGIIQRDDDYQRDGEPLVAVTHSPDHLAELCERVPVFTKTVIANEADKLARNIQAFDRIARTQRLLVVASHRNGDAIRELKDRGCHVWRLSPSDLRNAEEGSERQPEQGVVARMSRAVRNWQTLSLRSIDCRNPVLDEVAHNLETIGRLLDPSDARDGTRRIVGKLFSLLCAAGELCEHIDEESLREIETQLATSRQAVEQEAVWLPSEAAAALRAACDTLRVAYGRASQEGGKTAALRRLIHDLGAQGVTRLLLVTRTPMGAAAVGRALGDDCPAGLTIRTIAEVEDLPEAEAVIVTAWPNSRRLNDLICRYLAPSVVLMAYPFEKAWFDSFLRNRALTMRQGDLDPAAKASLTGLPIETFMAADGASSIGSRLASMGVTQDAPEEERPDVVRIEDLLVHQRKGGPVVPGSRDGTRPARYVSFFGTGYAYLSEWQNVAVITALIRGGGQGRARLSQRTVDALTPGDYVVFRGGAESNIVRAVAEQLTGHDEYARWRQRAQRWRKSLQSIFAAASVVRGLRRRGKSPSEIHAALKSLSLSVPDDGLTSNESPLDRVHTLLKRWGLQELGIHTVRRWLNDEAQIGPGREENLISIAKAASDDDLLARKGEIWESITAIRSLHIDAGRRLTQMILSGIQQNPPQVGSAETRIEIAGAPAWILQIEEIAKEYEEHPSNQVNRLLWDEAAL